MVRPAPRPVAADAAAPSLTILVAVAQLTLLPPRVEAYRRRRAGVPQSGDVPWWLRLTVPWLPIVAAVIAGEVFALAWMYRLVTASQTLEDGSIIPGFNDDALRLAATYALPTLAAYTFLVVLADRYRPQRLWFWLLAVSWGGTAACGAALFLNDWTSAHLAVAWWAPGYSEARVAIFVAPFVEEAAKATILFVIAWADRGRITSRVSGIVLAGLAAVGFAFTENIIYYSRLIVYGAYNADAGEVKQWLQAMALQRGLFYSFGHPLFTSLTGIGLALACRSRSKIVRVIAPLAGYLAAAFCHMSFNTLVSIVPAETLNIFYVAGMVPACLVLALVVVVTLHRQRRLIASRLTDYVVMGWLPASYPALFSNCWTRTKALLISPWHGNIWRTLQLLQTVTELAYLRDAVTRGVVDDGGLDRERELIGRVGRLRSQRAVEDPRGLRPYLWHKRAERLGWAPPLGLPAGTVASRRPGPVIQPVASDGSLRYSAVDPRWGPPA